jgi:hypothetical protein
MDENGDLAHSEIGLHSLTLIQKFPKPNLFSLAFLIAGVLATFGSQVALNFINEVPMAAQQREETKSMARIVRYKVALF